MGPRHVRYGHDLSIVTKSSERQRQVNTTSTCCSRMGVRRTWPPATSRCAWRRGPTAGARTTTRLQGQCEYPIMNGKSPFRGPGPRGPVRQCAREEIIVSKASRALHIVAYVTLSPLTSRRRGPAFFGPSPVYVGAASAGQRYLYDENGYARSGATRASTLTRERQTNSVLPRKLQLTMCRSFFDFTIF